MRLIRFLCSVSLLGALCACGSISTKLSSESSGHSVLPANEVASLQIVFTVDKSGANTISAKSIMVPVTANSVEIAADVPKFVTFNVTSDLKFNFNRFELIEADGALQMSIVYNDLTSDILKAVHLRASLMNQSGFTGQDVSSVVPVEIQINEEPYQRLSVSGHSIKSWSAPFDRAIEEEVRIRLRADFSSATDQQYKGIIKLELVRETL